MQILFDLLVSTFVCVCVSELPGKEMDALLEWNLQNKMEEEKYALIWNKRGNKNGEVMASRSDGDSIITQIYFKLYAYEKLQLQWICCRWG